MSSMLNANDYFNTVAYGPRSEEVSNFFLSKVDTLQSIIPDTYANLYQDIRTNATYVNSDYLRAMGENLLAHVGSMWKGDNIRPLNTVAELQAAPLSMQEYIMAEPTVRKLFHEQGCDGYSETYVDVEPGCIGQDHSTYRKVHHGITIVHEDDTETTSVYHSDMVDDGYDDLTISNKVDIMTTMAAVKAAVLAGKQDPTSSWATYL